MRIVFCPTDIKEIKEIMLPSLCAALSAISAISVGLLLPHADSFYCPDFYCPAEIKEIKEILLPSLCGAFLSFLSFLWDFYYTMRLAFPRKSILSHGKNSKFAASKKKIEFFLLSKVRFPTFVVRRRNRPAGEGNSGFNRDKPIIRISPPSHVASSDRMITASSLIRV